MKVSSKLIFDEVNHIYTVDNKILPSVTTLLKKVSIPFNVDEKSKQMEKAGKGNAKEIKESWKKINEESQVIGKKVHKFAEDYIDYNIKPQNNYEYNLINILQPLLKDNDVVAKEFMMYSEKYQYAGTADLILKKKGTEDLIIVDYKTNKDIFKNFKGQTLLEPFDFLLDSPFSKYQLQLNLYQLMLEELGYNVVDRIILWSNEKESTTYKVSNLQKQIKLWLQFL